MAPGTITLLAGPSGSGKSTVLDALARRFPTARGVGRVHVDADRPVIDLVAADHPFAEAAALMSACGLSEPRLWLHRFDELSEGERFRARLAIAIGLHLSANDVAPLFCDEFTAGVHRRLARAIAYNLRKLATRRRLCLVVATSHGDVTPDLQPDQLVRLDGRGGATVQTRPVRERPFSLSRRLVIEPASRRDYDAFAAMHYRERDELGFVDRCFSLREGAGGELLGIVIYAHAPLELRLRNAATNDRFKGNARRLNREMRILRRLVIHPDVRGCGLGQRLVRETLPRAGTRFVECLANLGGVNPVFERAGMARVGTCEPHHALQRILAAVAECDADPLSPAFASDVCRRPRVRRLVADGVRLWYRGVTRDGEERVSRQGPLVLANTFRQLVGSAPVYYLWERPARRQGATRMRR
jgi:energy-coupling factor transporter ATP-binding protein EcfA2